MLIFALRAAKAPRAVSVSGLGHRCYSKRGGKKEGKRKTFLEEIPSGVVEAKYMAASVPKEGVLRVPVQSKTYVELVQKALNEGGVQVASLMKQLEVETYKMQWQPWKEPSLWTA
jgi:hypothetical protein